MKFRNREEIKEILEMNISDNEKRNLIANLKNYKTDIGRIILVNEELEIEEGGIWSNLGKATSWTDRNANNVEFRPEGGGEIKYVLHAEGVEGYQVQYLSFENLFNELYHEQDLDEETAEEIADEVSSDEVYLELMKLLGSDGDMDSEAEVLVPSNTKLEIVEINDGRDDVGYIEVILKEVK
jgi:hypothetical protein